MVVIAPPNPESRRIAEQQTELELRMRRVEAGLRAAQLGNASLQGTGIGLYDGDGNYRGSVGIQPDGSAAIAPVPIVAPPVPSAPQVLPAFGPTLIVKATGETATGVGWPADWLMQPVYKVYYADAANPTVWTLGGTIVSQAGETVIGPLEYTQYLFALTAVGPTGLESEKSESSSGTPTQVVSADIINGIIQEVHLNADIVGAAQIKANAVTATKVAPDSIETPHLTAGAVISSKIAANQINAGHLTAGSVTTEKIQALAVTANELAANSVIAGKIQAGAVTAVKLEANMVIASRIIAGSATGARVEMHPTSGLQAYQSNGTTRTFWIDAATGAAYFMGELETASTYPRLRINPGGTVPDEIRFHQNATQFGYINAESAAGGNAGVAMRSQILNSLQGGVIAQPAEAAIELPNTTSTTSRTQRTGISLISTAINMWGGDVNIEGRDQYGNGRVSFHYRNTSGTAIAGASAEYRAYNSDTAYIRGVGGDTGFLYGLNGEINAISSTGTLRGAFGSYWNTPSSRRTKKNEKNPTFKAGAARAALRRVPVKMWNYASEAVPEEAPPTTETRTTQIPKYDPHTGRAVINEDGSPVYEEHSFEVPVLVHKPHLFPIAEDMQAIVPELVLEREGLDGGLGVDLRDVVGFLWKVCQEQDEEIDRLSRAGAEVPSAPRQASLGAGQLYERNGSLYYVNSVGVEKKVA